MVALLPRELEPIDVPGVRFYDAVASIGDVDSVEFFVPPYMGPADELVVLSRMPRLKVVQLLTAGYENALRYVPAGVTLCNAGGVHDASTAELAVGLMIASLRGIDAFARAMPSGTWLYGRREALADKQVLVIGAGGVGDAIRRRLEPFETDVVMVGRAERPGVHAAGDLPALLPSADIVVLAVPLTEATHQLVGTEFLALMRDGALLVNVSRGSVVDTDALTQQVAAGRVRVALDVTDPEPLPSDHPLWGLPGVLISPHVGGNTSAFLPRARHLVTQQLLRYASGEPLASVVSG